MKKIIDHLDKNNIDYSVNKNETKIIVYTVVEIKIDKIDKNVYSFNHYYFVNTNAGDCFTMFFESSVINHIQSRSNMH